MERVECISATAEQEKEGPPSRKTLAGNKNDAGEKRCTDLLQGEPERSASPKENRRREEGRRVRTTRACQVLGGKREGENSEKTPEEGKNCNPEPIFKGDGNH